MPQCFLEFIPAWGSHPLQSSMAGSPGKKGNNKLKRLGVNISEVGHVGCCRWVRRVT